jgi:hypothetical protein
MNGLPFINEPLLLILLTVVLAVVSIMFSIISLLLVRSAARRMASPPQPVAPSIAAPLAPPPTPSRPAVSKPASAAVRTEARPTPPISKSLESLEIKPAEAGEEFGFASLEEVASILGLKSAILLNQSGIPIDSYNVGEEDKVAASVADFISLIRRLNPRFRHMVSEGDERMMLLLIGRIGETEVYALTVGGGPEFGVEEVRGFLRTYLSEKLGRFK